MLCTLPLTVNVVEMLPQTVQTFGGRTFVTEKASRRNRIYFTVILSSQEEIPWIDPQM
jgi:hypothetical protein